MATEKEPWLFSDEAVGLMRQIAFGWEEIVLDVLNIMWEIRLNDRGYQHQRESALLLVRANREPDYLADPAAIIGTSDNAVWFEADV